MAQIIAPVTCSTVGCPRAGRLINATLMPAADADVFYDGYGQGSEGDLDHCPECKTLGRLEDEVSPSPDAAPHIPNCHAVLDPSEPCSCGRGPVVRTSRTR